jgi:hypothetical protein
MNGNWNFGSKLAIKDELRFWVGIAISEGRAMIRSDNL